ncbi:MAG: sodium/proline symporter [Pseudomonadota bacterium]
MEAYRVEVTLAFVAVYMVFCVVVGLWAMRRTQDASDFFVAGRHLGPFVVALAVFSSTLSGFGFVGGPGLVYSSGMSSLWMVIVAGFGYSIGFYLVAKRIRMVAGVRNALSLPDVVAARYNSEWARGLTAVTILLGVMGYLATQILAMALVLQSLLSATETFADVSLLTCVAWSLAVLVFYSVTGGIVASVYTDVIQGAIMAGAGLLILVAASSVFDGGLPEATSIIMADDPEAGLPFGTLGMITALGWGFVFGIGLAGQPHLVTKMMMNRKISDNRLIFPVSLIGYALAALLWFSIGIVMRATGLDGSMPMLDAPDGAAPAFLATFAHPLLAGVVFAALFAAIMSTSDAFLNIGTAAVIHDIPNALRGRSVENELFWARVVTVLITLVAAAFALYSYYGNERLVALLGAFGWGTFAAALVPVVVFGLNWKRATAKAAVVAIVASLLMNFAVEIFSIRLPFGISGPFLAMTTSMSLFLIVSLIDRPPKLAEDIERILDL